MGGAGALVRALAVAVLLAAAGCSDDDGSDADADADAGAGADAGRRSGDDGSAVAQPAYAVLRADGWRLREAVDPPADDPVAAVGRPPLAWFAEYVRELPNASQLVVLTGHDASFAETRATLEVLGFALDELDGSTRWPGVAGSTPDDPAGLALVVLDVDGAAVQAVSHDLAVEELVALVDGVEPVDAAGWTDAGGVVG